MKKYFIYSLQFLFIVSAFFSAWVSVVHADAWWGEGYRAPEWVRAHGGTTISYKITGTGRPDRYKAMMFREGKYVEVEFGKHATFDDAKNGTYLINFYKCKGSCMHQKYDKKTKIRPSDKKVASITIVARSGVGYSLIFDALSNTVRTIGRSGSARNVNPFSVQRAVAKKNDGKACQYIQSQKQTQRFEQFLFLTHRVNRDAFRLINIANGVLPQFLVRDTTENNILK